MEGYNYQVNEYQGRYKKLVEELKVNKLKEKKELDEACKTRWYRQDAFTKSEMMINKLTTIIPSLFILYAAAYYGYFTTITYQTTGFEAKSFCNLFVYLQMWILALVFVIAIKYFIYYFIGMVYGLQPLTGMEDFWLYDLPINPMNIPSILVFKKSHIDPNAMLDHMLKCIKHDTHCDLKFVKKSGKYFFKKLTDKEY